MRARKRERPREPDADLFGEIPVTWDEVWAWIEAVPGIPRTSWRARCYLKWWDVPVKIRAAKRAGVFDQVVDQVARGPLRTAPGNSLASIDWTLRSAKSANASAASAIQ